MANPLVNGLGVVNLNAEIEIILESKLPVRPDGKTYVDDIKGQHADTGTFFDEPLGTKDLSTPMVRLPVCKRNSHHWHFFC